MYREALEELIQWKKSSRRKPMVLIGARQTGKTWLMEEFGKTYYEVAFVFNFDKEPEYASVFKADKKPVEIIKKLGMLAGKKILPEKHLIIFDEIQQCPEALNSLKYFYEDANEYHIIVAGSLLGTYLSDEYAFPVGKVNLLKIYPMTFSEFLKEVDSSMYEYRNLLTADSSIEEVFHNKLLNLYHEYLVVGGMPECVKSWSEDKDIAEVGHIQDELSILYEHDITKHNKKINAAKILLVYRNIVGQLAKENKKFIYGLIREGARAKEYETAIMWLSDCGLVHKVSRVNTANIPLRAYEDLKAFKLFLVDVGLLGCMAGLRQHTLLDGNDLFVEFKGALTEQYVCQQLKTIEDLDVYYYTNDRGSCEVDFVIDTGERIVPVEVKAEINLRAKSLKTYREKFSPTVSVRTSMADYKKEEWLVNLPLYAIDQITQLSSAAVLL